MEGHKHFNLQSLLKVVMLSRDLGMSVWVHIVNLIGKHFLAVLSNEQIQ